MASDSCPSGNPKVKVRRRSQDRKRKKVQAEEVQGLTSAGHTALQEGRPQEALRHLSHALEAAGQLQDSRVIRACSFNLGAAHVEAGHAQKGLEFLRRAQPGPKADRLPDLQYNLGQAHNALGQDREAVGHFLRAAQLYRSQGDGGSEGHACLEMGRCHHRTQDWAPAAQAFLRAAESFRLAAMLDSAALALKEAGSVMIQSDQFSRDDIIGVLNDCLSETDRITDAQMQGELYLSVGVSFCQLRRFSEALGCFQAALGPMAERPPLLAKALHNLGATLNALGQFTPALQYHRLAAALYGSLGCRGDQAWCFRNLALALSRLGEEEEAAESLGHALQSFRDTEDPLAEAQVCELLAECYLRRGRRRRAVELYQQGLRALCRHQDSSGSGSGSVGDRLVERLSAALQRPHPLRPRPPSPQHHGSVARIDDITQSQDRSSNQHTGDQTGEEPPESRLLTAEAGEPPSDDAGGRGHLTDSQSSLDGEGLAPPTRGDHIREAPPPARRRRSRFCSLM